MMHYFALLISPERDLTPDEGAYEMTAYRDFHAKAASAILAGDALQSAATGVRITGGPEAPTVSDGPFAESAEVAGGYYVFEAENLDAALTLARDIPAARVRRDRGVADGPLLPRPRAVNKRQLAGAAAGAAGNHRRTGQRSGMRAPRRTRSSANSPATAPWAALRCIPRRRRRRYASATARCC